jgi:membrane-associated phospholipid phosphatase
MQKFLTDLCHSVLNIFRGKNLIWQGILIALTAFFVLSGFDWWYYETTRNSVLQTIGFTAGMAGFLVPITIPFLVRRGRSAVIQAGILGLAISSSYKVFTGRVGLPHIAQAIDSSHIWQFGILRGGAFQGWPSSHTSVAFAMSVALVMLYPEKKWLRYVAIGYALFIGLGASVAFHWWSDFVAGVILGSIIGIAVAKQQIYKTN